MKEVTSYYRMFSIEAEEYGETLVDIEDSTLSEEEFYRKFDGWIVERSPLHYTIWTKHRVYFPAQYDSDEYMSSAPRNPSDEKMSAVGGG